jgi:hypothetical protein
MKKRNSSQDGNGLVPRMDEIGSTDGKVIAPVGVGNSLLMEQKRCTEWKGLAGRMKKERPPQ